MCLNRKIVSGKYTILCFCFLYTVKSCSYHPSNLNLSVYWEPCLFIDSCYAGQDKLRVLPALDFLDTFISSFKKEKDVRFSNFQSSW